MENFDLNKSLGLIPKIFLSKIFSKKKKHPISIIVVVIIVLIQNW